MTPTISWPSSPQANNEGVGVITIIDRKEKKRRRRSGGIMISVERLPVAGLSQRRREEWGQATFFKSEKVARPRSHTYAFFIPASTRCGVNGASRRRTPTASKIALAIAAAIGALDGSPPPRAGISGRLSKTISISGTSGNLRMG